MTEQPLVEKATGGLGKVVGNVTGFARSASAQVADQASELKGTAADAYEKLTTKEPDLYEEAVVQYNAGYTTMYDTGVALLRQRERSTDLIGHIELLVNSIANTPKAFSTTFEEIAVQRDRFLEAEEFARRDLAAARASAASAGAGFAAGAAVATVAPTAAMWVATTFGTASTGTAISALSGAAASKAALAWLGGGTLATGGGGAAGGSALLALAGPVGWTVAGATLLASIALFAKQKFDNREAKHDATKAVMLNTARVNNLGLEIDSLVQQTTALREKLNRTYGELLPCFEADFLALSPIDQSRLAALVNNTKASAALLGKRIDHDTDESETADA